MLVADWTTNVGGAGAPAQTTTRYYLSIDNTLDASDVPLGSGRAVPGLAPGSSNAGFRSVRIPLSVPPGAYFIIAKADAASVLVESREYNNGRRESADRALSGRVPQKSRPRFT